MRTMSKLSTCDLIRHINELGLIYDDMTERIEHRNLDGYSREEMFWKLEHFIRTRLENNPQLAEEKIHTQARFWQAELAVRILVVQFVGLFSHDTTAKAEEDDDSSEKKN